MATLSISGLTPVWAAEAIWLGMAVASLLLVLALATVGARRRRPVMTVVACCLVGCGFVIAVEAWASDAAITVTGTGRELCEADTISVGFATDYVGSSSRRCVVASRWRAGFGAGAWILLAGVAVGVTTIEGKSRSATGQWRRSRADAA